MAILPPTKEKTGIIALIPIPSKKLLAKPKNIITNNFILYLPKASLNNLNKLKNLFN